MATAIRTPKNKGHKHTLAYRKLSAGGCTYSMLLTLGGNQIPVGFSKKHPIAAK